jgi:EmrB/QacA subfamily drug resistance transporter
LVLGQKKMNQGISGMNTDNAPNRKWWVLLAVGIGTFMSALDGSVVNTILPVIRSFFSSDVSAVEWIVVIYLLVVSSLLLTFGRLGDLYGHKRYYVSGFLIFIASSALCGLAGSVWLLVAARGLQALGAAMLFANSPAILTKSFPPQQRGRALGMQATMTYLGLTVGPSLGGWLTQAFSWRAVFYINVPVGLIAFALSIIHIEAEKPSETGKTEHFDPVGAILFSAGLVALLLGLNEGPAWGWFSTGIVACLLAAVLLLTVFFWFETRVSSPILDLSLFRERLFSASTASAILNYICLYSVIFLMPFYLIQGRGLDAAQAGLILTAQPIIMAIAAPISGSLSDRIGSRLLSTLGMAIMAVGLFLLSRLGADSSTPTILISLAVTGLGTGIFVSPNTSALMGSAPRQRQGIASGILATARNVGMVLGVGLAGAIFTSNAGPQMSGNSLYHAIQLGLTVGAAIAAIGVIVSLVRGNQKAASA